MDEFTNDLDSNASSDDQEHEQEQQDDNVTMEDADDMDADEEDAFNDDDDDQEDDQQDDAEHDHEQEAEPEPEADQERENEQNDESARVDAPYHSKSNSLSSPISIFRPRVRPEAVTARLYDIVPTMAAPQATSINAISITPDLRYWITGGSDGYIRKYDGPGTINGKQLLTVAQRHPFVDSVTKAGILMSYWENFESGLTNGKGGGMGSDNDRVLSPVYSLAVHSDALWLLSGLEGGGINLHSVRHDEGKTIHVLQGHRNAVSVLQLAPDEKSVLSGSWDKMILDWDLNSGAIIRDFKGSGGQISAIEPRPMSGSPIPAEAAEEPFPSETFRSSTRMNGFLGGGLDRSASVNGNGPPVGNGMVVAEGSDHESLFGSPAGSLFGDGNNTNMGGGNPFGGNDDNDDNDGYSHVVLEPLENPHGDGQGDASMGGDSMMGDSTGGDSMGGETLIDEAPQDAPKVDAPSNAQEQTQGRPDASFDSENSQAQPEHSQQDPPQASESAQSEPRGPTTALAQSAAEQVQVQSPSIVFNSPPPPTQVDPTQISDTTFLSASIDGTIRIWDRRVPLPLARIGTRPGVPPWCMGACWSPDGNTIYAGRRHGTVEEFNIHRATPTWLPERTLKLPAGSGAVSAVRPMVNGRHLVCASHDILRLYDLKDSRALKHGSVPFLIIPGPPRAGVISQLYIDPTSRFMISTAGTRGWDGSSTEVMIGYEITCVQ